MESCFDSTLTPYKTHMAFFQSNVDCDIVVKLLLTAFEEG